MLSQVGAGNVRLRLGDGWGGWPDAAPFQAIVSASATPVIPEALEEQLAPGGRLVLPLGGPEEQRLVVVRQGNDGVKQAQTSLAVRFVPHDGQARER